jgi:hypothetical protein
VQRWNNDSAYFESNQASVEEKCGYLLARAHEFKESFIDYEYGYKHVISSDGRLREMARANESITNILDEYIDLLAGQERHRFEKFNPAYVYSALNRRIEPLLRDLRRWEETLPSDERWMSKGIKLHENKQPPYSISIRNKADALRYSHILIEALENVAQRRPSRHHNQPPSDSLIEEDSYYRDVNELVLELKRLNSLLENKIPRKAATKQAVSDIHRHFDTFFTKFAGSFGTTLGTGIGGLLIGSVGALLYQAGLSHDLVRDILSRWKPGQ